MKTAILYDPKTQIASKVELNDGIDDFYTHIKCRMFATVVTNYGTVYCDDEGLFVGGNAVTEVLLNPGSSQSVKLAGNLLLLGLVDDQGNTPSVVFPLEDIYTVFKPTRLVTKG